MIADLPRGASLETTDRMLTDIAGRLKDLPELTSIQAYVGTAAPFNFNGLVRHYYLRDQPEQGDLSVNLVPKAERGRAVTPSRLTSASGSKAFAAGAFVGQGGRGSARAAGPFDPARRDRMGRTPPRGANSPQSPQGVQNGRFRRRR